MTILLAENDAHTLEIMNIVLTEVGYNVVVARDGKELVEKLDERVDVIIADSHLPMVPNNNFPTLVNNLNTTAPVIAVTALSPHEVDYCDHFATVFHKPIMVIDVLETLSKVLCPNCSSPLKTHDKVHFSCHNCEKNWLIREMIKCPG